MTDRREFLQGASLAALPLATGLPGFARAHARTSPPLGAVLFDDRHAESRAFAAPMHACGAAIRAVPEGDVTAIWLREIGPAWRRAPVPIAGLTRRPALFCLEQFAWAHGLRVVFHAEHILEAGGRVHHEVLRHPDALGAPAADELRSYGSRWPARVAKVVAALSERLRPACVGPSCAGLEPPLPRAAQLLTSWIIAAA